MSKDCPKRFENKGVMYYINKSLLESTTTYLAMLPANVSIETIVSNMTDEVSLKSRLAGVGLTYVLMPTFMLTKFLVGKAAKITEDSKSSSKRKLESLVAMGMVMPLKAGIYYFYAGETDLTKIAIGTLGTTAAAGVLAPGLLYLANVVKEGLGYEEEKRTPNWLMQKTYTAKKRVFAGAAAASLAAAALIYCLTPNNGIDTQAQLPEPAAIELTSQEYSHDSIDSVLTEK